MSVRLVILSKIVKEILERNPDLMHYAGEAHEYLTITATPSASLRLASLNSSLPANVKNIDKGLEDEIKKNEEKVEVSVDKVAIPVDEEYVKVEKDEPEIEEIKPKVIDDPLVDLIPDNL